MDRKMRSSALLGIVAASVVWVASTAVAQDQNQPKSTGDMTVESRQEQETVTRTVRRSEENVTTFGRGVTGDVPRPPANELSPEYTQRERHLYELGQMPGM